MEFVSPSPLLTYGSGDDLSFTLSSEQQTGFFAGAVQYVSSDDIAEFNFLAELDLAPQALLCLQPHVQRLSQAKAGTLQGAEWVNSLPPQLANAAAADEARVAIEFQCSQRTPPTRANRDSSIALSESDEDEEGNEPFPPDGQPDRAAPLPGPSDLDDASAWPLNPLLRGGDAHFYRGSLSAGEVSALLKQQLKAPARRALTGAQAGYLRLYHFRGLYTVVSARQRPKKSDASNPISGAPSHNQAPLAERWQCRVRVSSLEHKRANLSAMDWIHDLETDFSEEATSKRRRHRMGVSRRDLPLDSWDTHGHRRVLTSSTAALSAPLSSRRPRRRLGSIDEPYGMDDYGTDDPYFGGDEHGFDSEAAARNNIGSGPEAASSRRHENAEAGHTDDEDFRQWYELVPSLLAAYNRAEDITSLDRIPASALPLQCSCVDPNGATQVKVYDLLGVYQIRVASCRPCLADTMVSNRLFPASTKQVRTALSIPLLRLFQAFRKHSSVGAYGLANSFEDVWQDEDPDLAVGDYFRRQVMETAMWLQAVRVYGAQAAQYGTEPWRGVRPELDRDDLRLTIADLADSCPACFRRFEGVAGKGKARNAPPPPTPELIVSIDGNFSHKRKARINVDKRQPLPPRRFLSQKQVRETEARLASVRLGARATQQQHDCTAKVKAADPLAAKGALGPHDITGVMGLCCRHDNPIVFCDITSPGERHHYAIVLLLALFEGTGQSLQHIGVMYDIGCRFANNRKIAQMLPTKIKITWTIPLFHVYGHTSACQFKYSPRRVQGMGWLGDVSS
ncbi:hypothetical protein CF328_g4335 [Tilletia controversa]|nr:hypothetical protein CF328_g4335 [Tilletia controversa]